MAKTPEPHEAVLRLVHHRWSMPILETLIEMGGGARAVVLINRLGVNRNSLRTSLGSLQEQGLVAANAGHGHPLRPEFVLTEHGQQVAPLCRHYTDVVGDPHLTSLKWTAPVLLSLAEIDRFNGLQTRLGIGPRPLTLTLKALVAGELLARTVEVGHPPRSRYLLSGQGLPASNAVCAMATALVGLE